MSELEKTKVIIRGVKSGSVAGAVRECLELCQWEQVVARDALVVVKPNLCVADPLKVEMSNTAPAITEAVCEMLLTRTSRIVIGESSNLRHTAEDAFAASGYLDLARRLGVELVNFSQAPWTHVKCEPAGYVELPRVVLEADVFVTLPVLKTHALTYFTGALKNQWGCLPRYDRILMHKWLDPMLVGLHRLLQPDLTVMDGIVGMEGRGPTNGKPRRLDIVLAGRDAVAVDASAMRLVGLEPERARHLGLAAKAGLGRMRAEEIEIEGNWQDHVTRFEPAVLDRAVAAMNYMSRYRWFVRYALEKDFIFYPVRALVQALRRVGLLEGT